MKTPNGTVKKGRAVVVGRKANRSIQDHKRLPCF
jgi:hypothetical protein